MEVQIKLLYPDTKIPSISHSDDYGYDVYAHSCEEISPGVYKYGVGFALAVKRGIELIDSDIIINMKRSPMSIAVTGRPRSSIFKTGMILVNGPGTIDEGYRGEISFIFYHVLKDLPKYEIGDKIGQIHIDISLPIELKEVYILDEGTRGSNGFGSTGK